ncbi:MAG TPA: ABC transporter ATP-binding protein [Burkholderiales bacterium]|nr:ABC transporter ATP-binding protein [Burkholderiales bacterium]
MSFGQLTQVRRVFERRVGLRGRETLVAIDDASLTFEQGELVSLLGPSGCGKTTLLRILAGLIPKTSGSVKIRGEEVTGPHPDFGFVFQTPNLMPWRTVLDNVLFPMEILGRRSGAARARALELLAMVGLEGFHTARPHQLSGGMQQRVALCRALIHEPTLLLMDEPFGALDELTRMEMNDLLLEIRRRTQATVVFVTHSIAEAVYLSDQVLVFSRRPARIAERIAVDLPYPRTPQTRFSARFAELAQVASRALGVLH